MCDPLVHSSPGRAKQDMWPYTRLILVVFAVATLAQGAVVDFDMVVTGRATVYAGSTNQGPEERMFYTMGHLNASGLLFSVDSGSRWPWVYSSGTRECSLLKQPSQAIPCPNVPTYTVTGEGHQKNNSKVLFKYGAAFFSADPSVSEEGGFYTDTWEMTLTNSTTLPVVFDSFVGINKVRMNTPVLNVLQSGILGCGPPCFQANDTDTPCEPFFMGQLTSFLDTEEVFSYTLEANPAIIASGAVTVGAGIEGSTWQALSQQAYDQGLWYIDLEYSVGGSEFSTCVALVDTGGGPTYLPITDSWTFGRDCTGLEDLPSYTIRLPDSERMLEMTPEDYIIRIWDEETSTYSCESSTLFASSVTASNERAGQNNVFKSRYSSSFEQTSTPLCVIGMWTAATYPLSFSWKAGAEGVAFGG